MRFLTLACALFLALPAQAPQELARPLTQEAFFQQDRVWTAHLTIAEKDWLAMQPRGGSNGGGFGGSLVGPDGGRNGVAARQGIEFDYVPGALEIAGRTFAEIAVRYKGNGSYLRARGSDKISLKVDLNKYVKGQKLAGLSTINFQSNITDPGWMNEVLAYQLYRDAGAHAPRTAYAKLYLTVPGRSVRRYLGLYSISENVDENFIEHRFGTRQGAILKPSTRAPFTSMGTTWAAYNQTYDPKTDLTEAEKARLIEFCQFVSNGSDEAFAARIGDYVDLEAFARYFSVLVWIANADSLLQIGQNYYVYLHPETKKLTFVAWDQDGSFGNFRNSSPAWTIHMPWSGTNPFLARLYAVDAFRKAYLARITDLNDTVFRPDRFGPQLARIAPALRPAIDEEGRQWLPGFDAIASGQSGLLPFVTARQAGVAAELKRPQ